MGNRLARRAAWSIFPVQFLALDLYFRGPSAYLADPRLLASGVQSVVLWYLLGTFRTHRAARVAMALAVAAVLTVQALFFRCYHVPIDAQVAASAVHGWSDVRPVLAQMLPRTLATIAAVALIEYALLAGAPFGRSSIGGGGGGLARRRLALAGLLAVTALFAAPMREGTPELRLVPSVALLWSAPPAHAATAVATGELRSTLEELPSVLLILTESVRASEYCSAPAADCAVAPEMNRLLEGRIPLNQMRSLASYTAVSISSIVTGRTQEVSRDAIARAPSVFDLVKAVRAGNVKPTLAYWSAHSASVFEGRDVRGAVDSFITLESLLGRNVDDDPLDTGFDRLLTARAVREMPKLPKPYFLVLHFAGTHAPYFMDETRAPFQPSQHDITWTGLSALQNAYKNAIFEQDRSIAACVRAFLASQGTSPYLIAFTSDHGEAFGEHGAIHHGQNLYDEQIHVPGFVAASPGALRPDQQRALRAHEDAFVTHLDLLPTILDAYGVLDDFALAKARAQLAGASLLRGLPAPGAAPLPMPITNCTGLFPCPLNTWGMLDGARKLHAQSWDSGFGCFALDDASGERPISSVLRAGVDDAGCARLHAASKRAFPLLPNGKSNL